MTYAVDLNLLGIICEVPVVMSKMIVLSSMT